MKKFRSQLKVLAQILSNADIGHLMHFDEVWGQMWTEEQIRDYPPLDEQKWTVEDFKDPEFVEAYRRFLIDYAKQVAEENPEILEEMLEVMKSTVLRGKRLWKIIIWEHRGKKEYEIEARSKSDVWFHVATVLLQAHPRVVQVKVLEIKPKSKGLKIH